MERLQPDSRVLTPDIDAPKEQEAASRYPYIEVVGPLPVENEKVIQLFTKMWGIKPFASYCERHSFFNRLGASSDGFQLKDEVDFLTRQVQGVRGLSGFLKDSCAIHQQGLQTAKLYSEVYRAKGKIDAREHVLFLTLIDSLGSASLLPPPDLVLAVLAQQETIKALIEKRGGKKELEVLESGDVFLFEEALEEWIGENNMSPLVLAFDIEGLRFLNTQFDQNGFTRQVAMCVKDYVSCLNVQHTIQGQFEQQLLMPDFCIPKRILT